MIRTAPFGLGRRIGTASRRAPRGPTCRKLIGGVRCRRPPRYQELCKPHAIDLADELFRDLIRARDRRTCVECGRGGYVEVAHLQPRTKYATRWDPDNAAVLCWDHHLFFTGNPDLWDEWCAERLGKDAWELLTLKANLGGFPDLDRVIPELRQSSRSGR